MIIGRLDFYNKKIRDRLFLFGIIFIILIEFLLKGFMYYFILYIGKVVVIFLFNIGFVLLNVLYILFVIGFVIVILIFCFYIIEKYENNWFVIFII